MMRFIRSTAHYRLHASGHVNQYQLFVERALQALGPRGRLRPDSAVGAAVRRRQRRPAAGALRSVPAGHMDCVRQSPRDLPDSPEHALRAARRRPRRPDRRRCPMTDGGSDAASPGPAARRPSRSDGGAAARDGAAWLSRSLGPRPPHRSPSRHAAGPRHRGPALARPGLGDAADWGVTFGRELNATDDRRHFVPADSFRRARPAAGRRGQAPAALWRGRRRPRAASHPARAGARPAREPVGASAGLLSRCRLRLESRHPDRRRAAAQAWSPPTPSSARGPGSADADAWCLTGPAQQPRRELPGAPADEHARDNGADGAPAGAATRPRHEWPSKPGGVRAPPRPLPEPSTTTSQAFARLNAASARLYGLTPSELRTRRLDVSAAACDVPRALRGRVRG